MCDFPEDQHRCAQGGCHNGTYKTFCDDHGGPLLDWVMSDFPGYDQAAIPLEES